MSTVHAAAVAAADFPLGPSSLPQRISLSLHHGGTVNKLATIKNSVTKNKHPLQTVARGNEASHAWMVSDTSISPLSPAARESSSHMSACIEAIVIKLTGAKNRGG